LRRSSDFTAFFLLYNIQLRAEVGQRALVGIVASSAEQGQQPHARHQRAASGAKLLSTVGQGDTSVNDPQDKPVGIKVNRRYVLYKAAELTYTQLLLIALEL